MAPGRLFQITVIFLLFGPVSSGAQEPVTLERALQAALARNASLRAAGAAVDEAAAHAAEARSGKFPRLSVSESWQRGDDPVFVFSSLLSSRRFTASSFEIDALNRPSPLGFVRMGLGVEQMVFDGGRQRSEGTIATLRHRLAQLSSDEIAAQVALTTTQAFGRLVSSEAARRAAETGVAAAREDVARAERRRDAGMATDADVLGLVVHQAELQQRAIQAAGEAAAARADLNRLMGAAIDAPVHAVEPAIASFAEPGGQTALSVLLAEAEASRPELKRAAQSEKIAAAARRRARAAFVPQLAAQAAFNVAGTRFTDRASSWIVGGELRWTFSTGGGETAALKAANASIARTRAETADTRAAVHVEVVSGLHRVEAARARVAVGRAAVEQAREAQRIIRDRFAAGIASVNDVLRASTAVLDAEANSTAALVDTMVAAAMLKRSLGRAP